MSEEQSKITEDHLALIGVTGDPVMVQINEEDARRIRDTLEDTDPRYADGTGIAPPYVLANIPGARPRQSVQVLPGSLLTQQEWRFSGPLKIGQPLKALSKIIDIRERMGGRYGHTVLVTTSTDYYDPDGNHVAANMTTVSQFDPKGGRNRE